MSDLRFRITDQREEAIRQRATESVLWSEDEGRVPVPVADALWAAIRDRETLLEALEQQRLRAEVAEAAHKRECEEHERTVEELQDRVAELYVWFNEAVARGAAAERVLREAIETVHQTGSIHDHHDPTDTTGWNVHGIETCQDLLCVEALALLSGSTETP